MSSYHKNLHDHLYQIKMKYGRSENKINKDWKTHLSSVAVFKICTDVKSNNLTTRKLSWIFLKFNMGFCYG